MAQRNRAQRLNGLFPLSYMGVVPVSPSNFFIDNRPPTQNDSQNFYIGDWWLNTGNNNPPRTTDLYILVSLEGFIATWRNFGSLDMLTGDYGGPVLAIDNNINVITNNAANAAGSSVFFEGNLAPATLQLFVTDPLSNTMIGKDSGNLSLTGTDNTALGFGSGGGITTGSNNTVLGFGAGAGTTTGAENVVVGSLAGGSLTTGNENCFLGYQAGFSSTADIGSVCIGANSGYSITVTPPSGNVMVGYSAGQYLNGIDNVIIGYQAGQGTSGGVTGSSNVYIGCQSAKGADGATQSVAIGYQSGFSMTSGSENNVMIGYTAGQHITSSTGNVLIGTNAGGDLSSSTASNNVIIGNEALPISTASDDLVVIGAGAAPLITSTPTYGNFSVIIGSQSLTAATQTNANTILGPGAAPNIVSGTSNVLIGSGVAEHYEGSESGNIVIGASTTGITSESNAIHIGDTGGYTQAYIGGIYGNTPASGYQTVIVDSTGKLGSTSAGPGGNNNFLAVYDTTLGETFNSVGSSGAFLGTTNALTVIYDIDSVFYPGNGSGSPATFTAPSDGIYQFFFNCTIQPQSIGGTFSSSSFVSVVTSTMTYNTQIPVPITSAAGNIFAVCVTINTQMSTSDTATFAIYPSGSSTSFYVLGNVGSSGTTAPSTWITGSRIA